MRVIIQRVTHANVTVDGNVLSHIEKGFLLLVGITSTDTEETLKKVADKVAHLRIFEDKDEKMNLSIQDVKGSIISVSQFTLYADCKKGRRPSFTQAASPDYANVLYEKFNNLLRAYHLPVSTGKFGAHMEVSLLNDGPVTIILDSDVL